MRSREREDLAVTVTCFGVAGLALMLGMWIALGPLERGSAEAAAPVLTLGCAQGGCGAIRPATAQPTVGL